MKDVVSSLALAVAILVAAIVALIYIRDRGAIARNEAAKAVSEEETAAAQRRAAEAEAKSAEAKKKQAEVERERAAEEAKSAADLRQAKALEAENLAKERELAAEEAKTAADLKQAAADDRAAKEAEQKRSADELAIKDRETRLAEAKAKTAEHQRAIKDLEAKRIKESLEELNASRAEYARRLAEVDELRLELQEMKKAMEPELTVSDLMSLEPESASTPLEDDAGSSEVEVMMKQRRDNIPLGRRALEEAERAVLQAKEDVLATNRETVISALKAMLDKAISEKRAIDAIFYEKTIKDLYPDWRYLGPGEDGGEQTEAVKK